MVSPRAKISVTFLSRTCAWNSEYATLGGPLWRSWTVKSAKSSARKRSHGALGIHLFQPAPGVTLQERAVAHQIPELDPQPLPRVTVDEPIW